MRKGDKPHFQNFFSDPDRVDLWENVYDRKDIGSWSVQERMRRALEWAEALDFGKDARFLDAGCGAGRVSQALSSRGHEVFGMDFSFRMLQRAAVAFDQNGNKGVALLQGNVESLPFKSSQFNLIVSLGVVAYLISFEKALEEFSRVLAPEGVLIFSTLNKVNLVGLLDIPVLMRNQWRKLSRKKRSPEGLSSGQDPTTKRFFFTPSVVKSLKQHGFTEIKYETMPFRLLTFMGREIPPVGLNRRITELLEKMPALPVVGPVGGLCLFQAKKPPT
jgi:ubiquinone/menaquinone biosynthesis C-methylase UbiE